jgi:hypothetical protein
MCVVSAVTDHFRERVWPWIDNPMLPNEPYVPPVTFPYPPTTVQPSIPMRVISEAEWLEYQRLKKAAEEFDKAHNQPHCEKADLEAWEEKVRKIVLETMQVHRNE